MNDYKKEYTFKGTIEKRISKNGNEFECLVLKIGNYDKLVFLKGAEKELINLNCK